MKIYSILKKNKNHFKTCEFCNDLICGWNLLFLPQFLQIKEASVQGI